MFYDDKFQFKVSRINYLKMVPSGFHLTSNFPHKIYENKKTIPSSIYQLVYQSNFSQWLLLFKWPQKEFITKTKIPK